MSEVDSFDLPDACGPDHVTIWESSDPYEPPYYAVPFNCTHTWDDGSKNYLEAVDFTVTERYREAVAERASVPLSDLKLRREMETYHIGDGP